MKKLGLLTVIVMMLAAGAFAQGAKKGGKPAKPVVMTEKDAVGEWDGVRVEELSVLDSFEIAKRDKVYVFTIAFFGPAEDYELIIGKDRAFDLKFTSPNANEVLTIRGAFDPDFQAMIGESLFEAAGQTIKGKWIATKHPEPGIRSPLGTHRAEQAAAMFESGKKMSAALKWGEAVGFYNQSLELDPNHAESFGERGRAYFEKAKADKDGEDLNDFLHRAANDLDAAVAGGSTNPVFYALRADVYEMLGDKGKAISCLRDLLKLSPESEPAKKALARLGANP